MWTSKTRQFGQQELGALESMSVDDLAGALCASDPVVALRALAEVMLNGDTAKLDGLLKDVALRNHWQAYASDSGVDEQDREYARRLNERLR